MTNTMIVDTLKFSENLQNAGLDKKIADTLTREIQNIQEFNFENLATKEDLKMLELATKKDLKTELQALEYKLTIKLGTMMALAIAIMTSLQKLL